MRAKGLATDNFRTSPEFVDILMEPVIYGTAQATRKDIPFKKAMLKKGQVHPVEGQTIDNPLEHLSTASTWCDSKIQKVALS